MARILVVEDEEALRRLCRAELAEDGHSAEAIADGDEALERIKGGGLDLVVLELGIQGASGFRVLREGLQHDPHLPIIIHTAHPDFQRDFSTWSAAAFVVKSSDLSQLRAEVQRVLDTQALLKSAA
jgi:DNA-binding NtrC family response regulator